MKIRNNVLWIGAILLGFLFVHLSSGKAASLKTQDDAKKWQHLAMTVEAGKGPGDAEASRQIVKLGGEGWELVGVATVAKNGTTTKLLYYFKKPK